MSYKRLHSRLKGSSQSKLEQAINAFAAEGPAPEPTFTPTIHHPNSDYCSEIEAIRKLDAKLGLTFERLNKHQRHAVFHPTHNAILSAMVGSGKTTVLIAKIFYLHFIKEIPFSQMVVLTFTNKAAREIKERIASFLNEENTELNEELRFFGTFHSIARQLLQEHPHLDTLGFTPNFMIMDEREKKHFLERLIAQENLNIKYLNKITQRWRKYHQKGDTKMGNMKNEDDLVQLIHLAQKEKQVINTMDFDDLISLCNQLMEDYAPTTPQWIIVDEFQDCNEEQVQLIEHLKGKDTQLFVVGDQNQSIYGWRGSKEGLFQETQERWETTWMELPQNYRSTKTILTAAESLLQSDDSALIATRQSGNPIDLVRHFDDQQEAYYLKEQLLILQKDNIPLDTVAVLFRTHQQIGIVETVLQQAGIPHQLVKRTELHEDKAQSFLLHLLKVCINTDDIDACLSLICDSTFGVCKRSQTLIRQLKDRATNTSALEATIQYLEQQKTPSAIHLNLLHKVRTFIEDFTTKESIKSQDLMAYFALESLLKPTSIHHKEYMESVTEGWTQLVHYAKQQGDGKLSSSLHIAIDQVVLEGTFQINDREKEKGHGVHLLTIHASKGLEFDSVYIAGANTGIIPLRQHQKGNENIQEEKRLLFVAITRGKNKVEIGWHAQPSMRNTESFPSYFLNHIPESILHRRTAKDSTPATKTEEEWSINTLIKHKKYGSGKITALDDKGLICTFDSVGDKTFSRAFAKALLTIME